MSLEAEERIGTLELVCYTLAIKNPGRPQSERMQHVILDDTPSPLSGYPVKALRVSAHYGRKAEQMVAFSHPEYVKWENGFDVKGYMYLLLDEGRDDWDRVVVLTRREAIDLLDGIEPAARPMPERWDEDPFKGLS